LEGSFVTPISFVSELQGIKDEAPAGTEVDLISPCTLDPATAPWKFIGANGQTLPGFHGQYFTTPDLSGAPAVTRVDSEIDFDLEEGQIPVSQNQATFSAKWTGQIVAQISGETCVATVGVRPKTFPDTSRPLPVQKSTPDNWKLTANTSPAELTRGLDPRLVSYPARQSGVYSPTPKPAGQFTQIKCKS
jgi:hypothetical protein